MDYLVNVRAIIRGPLCDAGKSKDSKVWEVYDYERPSDDGIAEVRCDTQVRVTAASAAEAIEEAKANAPALDIPGIVQEDVTLWVDEEIDVMDADDPEGMPLQV